MIADHPSGWPDTLELEVNAEPLAVEREAYVKIVSAEIEIGRERFIDYSFFKKGKARRASVLVGESIG